MPQVDWITVKGFKSLRAMEKLKLHPINVIIGSNGSGKSNFIGVFSFLHAIRSGKLQEYVLKAGGAERILHFGSRNTEKIHLHISFENETNQYSITLQSTDIDELVPIDEQAIFWDKSRYPDRPYSAPSLVRDGKEAGISSSSNNTAICGYVRDYLDGLRVYHFHDTSAASPMKKTADIHDNDFLRPDGSNIAPFLYYLQNIHPTRYAMIRQTVQRVAPFFDDFNLKPQRLNPDKLKLEWHHKGSDAYFDATSLSDGTIRFIALATLFLQPDALKPSMILVDEPELGLHPYAIAILASLIKSASTFTQIVVSTQSSLLLDYFNPEDVLVADRVAGSTTLARLESEKLGEWLDDFGLGQLWEKNEIGGRPKSE